MEDLRITFGGHNLELAFVPGKENIGDFYMARTLTTQAFWNFVTDEDGNRFQYPGEYQPTDTFPGKIV